MHARRPVSKQMCQVGLSVCLTNKLVTMFETYRFSNFALKANDVGNQLLKKCYLTFGTPCIWKIREHYPSFSPKWQSMFLDLKSSARKKLDFDQEKGVNLTTTLRS